MAVRLLETGTLPFEYKPVAYVVRSEEQPDKLGKPPVPFRQFECGEREPTEFQRTEVEVIFQAKRNQGLAEDPDLAIEAVASLLVGATSDAWTQARKTLRIIDWPQVEPLLGLDVDFWVNTSKLLCPVNTRYIPFSSFQGKLTSLYDNCLKISCQQKKTDTHAQEVPATDIEVCQRGIPTSVPDAPVPGPEDVGEFLASNLLVDEFKVASKMLDDVFHGLKQASLSVHYDPEDDAETPTLVLKIETEESSLAYRTARRRFFQVLRDRDCHRLCKVLAVVKG